MREHKRSSTVTTNCIRHVKLKCWPTRCAGCTLLATHKESTIPSRECTSAYAVTMRVVTSYFKHTLALYSPYMCLHQLLPHPYTLTHTHTHTHTHTQTLTLPSVSRTDDCMNFAVDRSGHRSSMHDHDHHQLTSLQQPAVK